MAILLNFIVIKFKPHVEHCLLLLSHRIDQLANVLLLLFVRTIRLTISRLLIPMSANQGS